MYTYTPVFGASYRVQIYSLLVSLELFLHPMGTFRDRVRGQIG
ncbi:MAG: hypothetical protein PUI84_01680 [Bacteroidales bacterium]|nr:hypothetical protein [Bacteroidales bacterium]MDY3103028.1 hypothetical protein [Porphyromonas sp.]